MAAPQPAPTPPPSTDYAAKIEDLEIIATGALDKINGRIKQLKDQRDVLSSDSPEYKALDSRIKILEAAATAATKAKETEETAKKAEKDANKKDKGSKKTDDDLAYWSGRVANASTNAFSASVNGISAGLTGWVISLGGASTSAFLGTASTSINAVNVKALKSDMNTIKTTLEAARNSCMVSDTENEGTKFEVTAMETVSKALNTITGMTLKS